MIWICEVVVFEGTGVLIHLKVEDRALVVARGDGYGAPLDDMLRTSHLRSQPQKAPILRTLLEQGLFGCLVAIIRHAGSRLNPSEEISQFGAPGREFTESANTKASNFMRAGVGGTGPVSHNEGFDRSLGTCRGARVVFLVKGLRGLRLDWIMDWVMYTVEEETPPL